MRIKVKSKPRKDGSGLFTVDGSQVFIGKDWALQNEIDEAKRTTSGRSCFRGCNTCGACANSQRDSLLWKAGPDGPVHPHKSFDHNEKRYINCRDCEPFRYHDCNNGVMRDSRQEAEPFTEDQVKIIEEKSEDGKPLI